MSTDGLAAAYVYHCLSVCAPSLSARNKWGKPMKNATHDWQLCMEMSALQKRKKKQKSPSDLIPRFHAVAVVGRGKGFNVGQHWYGKAFHCEIIGYIKICILNAFCRWTSMADPRRIWAALCLLLGFSCLIMGPVLIGFSTMFHYRYTWAKSHHQYMYGVQGMRNLLMLTNNKRILEGLLDLPTISRMGLNHKNHAWLHLHAVQRLRGFTLHPGDERQCFWCSLLIFHF